MMSRKKKILFEHFISVILVCTMCLTFSPTEFFLKEVKAIGSKDNEGTSLITVEYNVGLDKMNCDKISQIHIKDRKFDPSRVDVCITAQDKEGNDVKEFDIRDIKANIQDKNMWTTEDNCTWNTEIKYDVDAVYTFKIMYTDSTGRVDNSYEMDKFLVDKTSPDSTKFKFSYSKPLVEKIIEAVTFGYYKANVDITVEADDNLSGVDYFKWACIPKQIDSNLESHTNFKYEKIDRNKISYSNNGNTAKAIINLEADEAKQFKGNFSFIVVDKAGNESTVKTDNSKVIVTDTVKPIGKIECGKPGRIVKDKEQTTMYYNKDVEATLKIRETNFYAEDVVIKVNGEKQESLVWKQEGEEWISKIKIADEGEYFISMEYMDKSFNEMEPCESNRIIIDKVQPLVEVKYSACNPTSVVQGREYYDCIQATTIKITEHNFNPKYINVKVMAKDIQGKNISIEDYNEYLQKEESWIKEGDCYTAGIIFSKDANYSLNIQCSDLATNTSCEVPDKLFTVDRTPPVNLNVSYSESILEKLVHFITFGYYNEKVKVTLTAEDDISGVMNYAYRCINDGKVEAIKTSDVVYSNNGKTSSISFEMPKDGKQFNGTVEFTVSDRAKNISGTKGYKRVVVDNIAPVCSVEYNSPVHKNNNISYYKGDITADISIIESNFYAEDVEVKVSKNGAVGYKVKPTWSNVNNNKHVGKIKISDEGKYIVSVSYKDRSNNTMVEYKSNELIIDRSKPVVEIKNISNNVAKKDKKISVFIAATDLNFDVNKFIPKLQGVVRDKNGRFSTINIPLKGVPLGSDGHSYSYSIDNIELDGIYSLTCIASDLSGNSTDNIVTIGSDKNTMSTVNFSVNRNGSTFKLDDKLDKILKNFYVQNIKKDVQLIETNADALQGYKVTVNGVEIAENKDYSVKKSGGSGHWNEYKYSIKSDLFKDEGEYNIVVYSKDKADNEAFSDIRNAKVSFVVDRTKPVVVVSGLQSKGRYSLKSQKVTVIPKDDGGKLNNIKVVVQDKDGNSLKDDDGKDIGVRMSLSGEKLEKTLDENENKLTFDIPSGLGMNVKVICNDLAIDDEGKTNTCIESFENITVSDKWYIILYANKFLFNTILVSVLLVIISGSTIYVIRRKKKNDNSANDVS